MFWTYILQSETSGRFYVGHPDDLEQRLHHGNLPVPRALLLFVSKRRRALAILASLD